MEMGKEGKNKLAEKLAVKKSAIAEMTEEVEKININMKGTIENLKEAISLIKGGKDGNS